MAARASTVVAGIGFTESIHIATELARERLGNFAAPLLLNTIEIIAEVTFIVLAIKLLWMLVPRILILFRVALDALLSIHRFLSSLVVKARQTFFDGICWLLTKITVLLKILNSTMKRHGATRSAAQTFVTSKASRRTRRTQKKPKPFSIEENMEVLGSDGKHVGIVDHLEGAEMIKLTNGNPRSRGERHFIPVSLVHHVDSHVHLRKSAKDVISQWRAVS
jgi:hypothetical protein